jgi:uncharacterized membrane protein
LILVGLLAVLVGSFAALSGLSAFMRPPMAAARRGQISLALLFAVTGVGHFVETEAMAQMLPPSVPGRVPIIWASGVFEFLLAVGLLLPRYARLAGIAAIVFLIAVFPGNVYAAMNHVPMGGHEAGPRYLLVRGPFQLLLIIWAWLAAVRRG